MAYRLVCIYETYAKPDINIRIEVCTAGVGKSLPPFNRRVTLDNIYREGATCDKQLLSLINHTGQLSQPFRINNSLLHHPQVVALLKSHADSYIESQSKGSIRKGIPPLKETPCGIMEKGHLAGGELYIDHLASWHRKIRVRLRYTDTLSSFFPTYSSLPYITTDGDLRVRDQQAEDQLLDTLGDYYDAESQTLTIRTDGTKVLSELTQKGWTLYVVNQHKQYARVHAYSNPSGIVWFTNDEKADTADFSHILLEGYLKSRNYHESDGIVTLFQQKDATKVDNQFLVEQLGGGNDDVLSYYTQYQTLTQTEIQAIDATLKQHLKGSLYAYQHEGVLWLQEQRKNNHGCLLADEMGLGKTIQVIAHLCCLNSDSQHLVIAPTSLIYNWQNEVMRFAPHLIQRISFVSYDMLRIHLSDYTNQIFDTVIIDEAQIIKNRQTKKYQAITQLQCNHKIILTGTPIENSIEELWSHFMMLMPSMRSLHNLLVSMGVPAVHEAYITLSGKLLKPFILRREKKSVLTDLPERIEKTVYIELSDSERTLYSRVHSTILQAFAEGVSGRINSIALEGLLRLRQACVSPHLLPQSITGASAAESTKLRTAIDYITTFQSEGRKVLVFSQFVSALTELEKLLLKEGIRFVTLYGDTHDRKTPVKSFQSDKNITAFLISLKAGGVGLNLTAADRVILLDDWWNPAVEDQAMSRSHRIGQRHDVLVLRLICKDTVEEKILLLQEQKRQTVDLFNATTGQLTIQELKELIG